MIFTSKFPLRVPIKYTSINISDVHQRTTFYKAGWLALRGLRYYVIKGLWNVRRRKTGSQMSPACDLNVNNTKQYLFNVLSEMEILPFFPFISEHIVCRRLCKQQNTCKIASNICNDMWQWEHNFLSSSAGFPFRKSHCRWRGLVLH